jgi:hypothetical protein
MTKVSSNAGKHPYLRTDLGDLFKHIRNKDKGIKIDFNVLPVFKNIVDTEYKDKNRKRINYKDVVNYKNEEYLVTYNSKEFYWIIENLHDKEKVVKLSEIAGSVVIKKKYNKIS